MAVNFAVGTSTIPSNGVTRQQLLDAMYTLEPATGTILKALQDSATGIVKITNATAGAKAVTPVASTTQGETILNTATLAALREYLLYDAEAISSSTALSLTKLVSICTAAAGGPFTVTLANGTYTGQLKYIHQPTNSVARFICTGTFAGFTQIQFGNTGIGVGYSAVLQWDINAWQYVGGNATLV